MNPTMPTMSQPAIQHKKTMLRFESGQLVAMLLCSKSSLATSKKKRKNTRYELDLVKYELINTQIDAEKVSN